MKKIIITLLICIFLIFGLIYINRKKEKFIEYDFDNKKYENTITLNFDYKENHQFFDFYIKKTN